MLKSTREIAKNASGNIVIYKHCNLWSSRTGTNIWLLITQGTIIDDNEGWKRFVILLHYPKMDSFKYFPSCYVKYKFQCKRYYKNKRISKFSMQTQEMCLCSTQDMKKMILLRLLLRLHQVWTINIFPQRTYLNSFS